MRKTKIKKLISVSLVLLSIVIVSFYCGVLFEQNRFIEVTTPDGIIYVDKKKPTIGICIADSVFMLERLDSKKVKSLRWYLNNYIDTGVISSYNRMNSLEDKNCKAYKKLNRLLSYAAEYRNKHPRPIDSLVKGNISNDKRIKIEYKVDAILKKYATFPTHVRKK